MRVLYCVKHAMRIICIKGRYDKKEARKAQICKVVQFPFPAEISTYQSIIQRASGVRRVSVLKFMQLIWLLHCSASCFTLL